ncbi:MAG: CRISPR-associated endonuclease Cas1 [Gaiellaceae bacterium]
MQREPSSAPSTSTFAGEGVCVVDGYACRVHVTKRHLHVTDGVGRSRRERRYTRATSNLKRLVVFGHSGSISFEALRWLADVNAAFVQVDRDGRVLATSAPRGGDVRLRRAQALAVWNDSGLQIAHMLLRRKLDGQRHVLAQLPQDAVCSEAFAAASANLDHASSVNELLVAERDAALAYWRAWAPITVRFGRADRQRVPEHWTNFGVRGSPIADGPRAAGNPINALLNYLYAILEAETRIGCLTIGLDPALGVVHADVRGRDSLALDIMETARAAVDEYVLRLTQTRAFRLRDFHETSRGVCRLAADLAKSLAETTLAWRDAVAPSIEDTARLLAKAPGARIDRVPTPLTHGNRRTSHPPRRQPPKPPAEIPLPAVCRGCGEPLPLPDRAYCNSCLPDYEREQFETTFSGSGLAAIEQRKAQGHDPTHTPEAERKRGATIADRKREIREWEAQYGRVIDLTVFSDQILPLIEAVPLSRLVRATGLSLRYCSQVRRGEKTPHPRHWDALRASATEGS